MTDRDVKTIRDLIYYTGGWGGGGDKATPTFSIENRRGGKLDGEFLFAVI
jgi:hypothetical protein